jgi:cob(I)alamin adenosyltransferase
MTKRTRIYTRTGDDGTTGLIGGRRIKKNALRIETYGTVDELSCALGVARAALRPSFGDSVRGARLDAWLSWSQDALFNLGSCLAAPGEGTASSIPSVGASEVAALERAIDEADRDLAPLNAFILPGGSLPAASLQLARAICRRAERLLVTLRENESVPADAARFLNRLSDALFVWSRWINDELGTPEPIWNPNSSPPT